jgi:hypothetical protein
MAGATGLEPAASAVTDRGTQRQPPLLDAIFADLFVEKPSVNAEKFRRLALIPLRLSQSAFDKRFFQLREVTLPADLKRHLVGPLRTHSVRWSVQLDFGLGHDPFVRQDERRSIVFSSSRTLPGQWYSSSIASAWGVMEPFLPPRFKKCWTREGISWRRGGS